MVAWIAAMRAVSSISPPMPLCEDGNLGFASISRRNWETPHSQRVGNRIAPQRLSPEEGPAQVRPARSVWLLASVVLFAGLSLFASKAAFGAAQQSGARPSETDLDRVEALLGRGRLDEAISLLENLQRKRPEPSGIDAKLGKAYYKKRSF